MDLTKFNTTNISIKQGSLKQEKTNTMITNPEEQIVQSTVNTNIYQKLEFLRTNANFYNKNYFVHDKLSINIFVTYDRLDSQGNIIKEGVADSRDELSEKAPQDIAITQFQTKQVNCDASIESSDFTDQDDDEKQGEGPQNQKPGDVIQNYGDEKKTLNDVDDSHDDDEEEKTVFMHRYTVDLIADSRDQNEQDLIFHWAVGRSTPGEWTRPDDVLLPPNSIRINQTVVQSKFERSEIYPEYTSLQIIAKWLNTTGGSDAAEKAIQAINLVLMEPTKNWWHNNKEQNYQVPLAISTQGENEKKSAEGNNEVDPELLVLGTRLAEIVFDIIQCETVYQSWTLMHRYFRVHDLLRDRINLQDRGEVALLYVWLRFSFIRQLTWQKRYNTKPKDLQHAQQCLVSELVGKYQESAHNAASCPIFLNSNDMLRLTLGLVGKGSGNGQRVRDEILNIMHRHHISERAGHFYEQWHQKLHNNTTPDDIGICEALLAYLRSGGQMHQYWKVLADNGISRERLASFDRKITEEPYHLPHTIGDFENYLGILKQLHSSGDLNMLCQEARYHLGPPENKLIDIMLQNFHSSDVIAQIDRVTELRKKLADYHLGQQGASRDKLRDLLFLDLALEAFVKTLCDKIISEPIPWKYLCKQVGQIIDNLCFSFRWDELKALRDDWHGLAMSLISIENQEQARQLKSIVDRLRSMLCEVNETYTEVIQPKATLLGEKFEAEDWTIKLFAEECLRASLFFSLSMIIKRIEPDVRRIADLGDWLVISQGRSYGSRGICKRVSALADVMFDTFEEQTVLLVEKVNGEEEVPSNVQAIVYMNPETGDHPDVLAHVSVRARNLKVMLAVLFEAEQCKAIAGLEGRPLLLTAESANLVRFEVQSLSNVALTRRRSSHLILQSAIESTKTIQAPPQFPKPVMQLAEFSREYMGAKSTNIRILRERMPKWILTPDSVCLPFQLMEHALAVGDPAGAARLMRLMRRLTTTKNLDKMTARLFKAKQIVLALNFVKDDLVLAQLKKDLGEFGVVDFAKAWSTIKKVWASKFNERAFLSIKKIGARLDQVFMAVLVQRVVRAEYAYVIHTTNPTNGDEGEIYAEACKGLGESLVSDKPGTALSFSVIKQEAAKQRSLARFATITGYPNKPIELQSNAGFIFRSDSNSEDLPGFAGAGLFDSFVMDEEREIRIAYSKDRLATDAKFRQSFMMNVGEIGEVIEAAYDDEAQDIEGCLSSEDLHYYVVQTRPQV